MLTLNWFDLVLGITLLWSAASGLRAGLARVVVGLCASVFGLLAGFWCYRMVAEKLRPYSGTPALANILGFALIFVAVLLLGSLLAAVLSRLFRWVGLSWFNHLLGGVAGLLRGAILIAATVDILVAFAPSPLPRAFENSRVLPYASEISAWLADMAPRELKDAFTEQMQNLKQLWAKPHGARRQEAQAIRTQLADR
jgi:membrane protein required for colicin V production